MSALKVRGSHTTRRVRPARTPEQAGRVWDRAVQIALGIVVIFILIGTIGPTVRYWFSGQRTIVDTLSSSTVYVGAGAAPVDTAAIAGIIGTRPLAVVSLSSTDSLAKDTYDTCTGVVDQLQDLIVKVVVDGATVAGCEGKDVEFGSGVNALGWDYVFWQTQSGADSLLVGDLPAITQQLALAYDAEVKGGRLIARRARVLRSAQPMDPDVRAGRRRGGGRRRPVLPAAVAVAPISGRSGPSPQLGGGTGSDRR